MKQKTGSLENQQIDKSLARLTKKKTEDLEFPSWRSG